jgi:hypothetical protein
VIDHLLAEQQQLRACAIEVLDLTSSPSPCSLEELTIMRWRLARLTLRHLQAKDRVLYPLMRALGDPALAAQADVVQQEGAALFDRYDAHEEHWSKAAVLADWPTYQATTLTLIHDLLERFDRAEAALYPLLRDLPPMDLPPAPKGRDWAAERWKMRKRLGID